MDTDLELKIREELIGEARRLRGGIRAHRDSTVPASAGIIPSSGVCFPSGAIRCRPCRSGPSSCRTA